MTKRLDRPTTKKRRPNEDNEFIELHSDATNNPHVIRKSHIARWCPSLEKAPGSRVFFLSGDNMYVVEDFQSITECMLEE